MDFTKENAGVLAGPESAAEHVRNALQLIQACSPFNMHDQEGLNIEAARARLVAALAILENKQ